MAAGFAAAKVGHLSAEQDSFNGWLVMSSLPKFRGWDEEVLVALMLCNVFCWTQMSSGGQGVAASQTCPSSRLGSDTLT